MFQTLEYIKFLFKSTNQHGVHSPFVFDLITKCFYDTTTYDDYTKLSEYRSKLLKNSTTIDIKDFGSGSRVFKSNTRPISAIAKTSGTTKKRAELLYRIVNYFKPKHSLELGTSLGIATQAMALGNSKNNITSIEGCPNTSAFTSQQLSDHHIKNVHNDSLFIFDDIYWSNDMREAWKAIKQHPKVTVTIDTFFWGFVFFRKEQAKENFTIRL